MTLARRLVRSTGGASAAEFALVLPLLLLLLFGIIDAGRFMWEYNRAEKATQMGVRFAAVTDPVLNGLDNSYSFSIDGGLVQGSAVPAAYFTSATCTDTACSCSATAGNFCGSASRNPDAFTNIVNQMKKMYPPIMPANVEVDYKNVGLGFAGNPDGSDVSPLVTVKFRDDNPLVFYPITCMIFACSISMPDFRASLTGEDLNGNISN